METKNKILTFRTNARVVAYISGTKFYATAEIQVTGIPPQDTINTWKSCGTDCETFEAALKQLPAVTTRAIKRATADLKKLGAL